MLNMLNSGQMIPSFIGIGGFTGKLTPSFPAWLPFNFCMLPVSIMFLIQTKPHIAAWKKGLFFGALTAFVGEPIFTWAGYYVLTGWHIFTRFPSTLSSSYLQIG
jgi:hypothetical protein